MAIAPMSADQSAAAWAGEAAGAAEAYVESQADAAARLRDLEEKLQAQLAAQGTTSNDGVDPPPPPPPAHQSFWQNDPNRPGGSPSNGSSVGATTASPGSGSGGGLLMPDGNGNYIYIPPDTANISITQLPETPDFILPIGNSGGPSSPVQTPSNAPAPPGPQAAPSGANEVNKPDQPVKPKEAPPVVTGLGEDVDKILNASKLLREQWAKLKAADWRIEFTDHKSHTDHKNKRIRLNPAEANTTARGVVLFSHELGHAVSGPPTRVTAAGRTTDDYVKRNVEARLTAEGAAAFENCKHREDIQQWSDIDITIAGKNADGPYLEIYEDFKSGKISEETAKYRMGQLMGEELEEYRARDHKAPGIHRSRRSQQYEDESKNAR